MAKQKPKATARRVTTHAPARSIDPSEHRLREQLVAQLRGGHAHLEFHDAVADWPRPLRGVRPAGQPFTPWQVLEHMRIAQWDILEFSRDPAHVSPEWPAGYWTAADAPPTPTAWEESVAAFERDLASLEGMAQDPTVDLFAPIPHGTGQTILRELLVAANHNSYHLGQLVLLRRLVGAWER